MKQCVSCGKFIEDWLNYCNGSCQIDLAKKNGGKVIAPNELPITCVRWDNTMLEHEHADHPDYKFPVVIEFTGQLPEELPDWDSSYKNETVALIYNDRSMAVTMHECCYDMWHLKDGKHLGGTSWYKEWKLTEESLKKILEKTDKKYFNYDE